LSGRAALCNDGPMAKTVVVKLTDDIDGGDADESIQFSLDGRSYEIDLNSANAAKLREAMKPFMEKGRGVGGSGSARSGSAGRPKSADKTLYSQLSDDEKNKFRAWANMATARRISDARVNSWIAAGRP
jgi:hypothetical protein